MALMNSPFVSHVTSPAPHLGQQNETSQSEHWLKASFTQTKPSSIEIRVNASLVVPQEDYSSQVKLQVSPMQ